MKAFLLLIMLRAWPEWARRQTADRGRAGAAVRLALALLALWSAIDGAAQAQTIVTDTGAPTTSFMSALSAPGLQPFWVGYVGADRGLGFQGQYFSFGGLVPLTTDVIDGTWFLDARAHLTTDNTQFFGNLGFGRRQYVDFLNSIVGVSGWYDYDGDAYQNYGYRYNQLGVSAELFNPVCDFRFNGYLPVGTTSHVLNQFDQNYLLYVNGIDTALQGGDAKFSVRPAALAPLNGYIDIGGYYFRSDVVTGFGGISSGFGVQPLPGVAVNLEVNHDEVFGTTGFVRVAFGLRGSPGNTRTGTRLLEPTRRNDHIVRFNQQPEIATNPNTLLPYNVIHVDNSAAAGGNGTVQDPFKTLAAAQAASKVNDIIYVHRGTGTTVGYDTGIVLKNSQMLLGSGNSYVIQTTEVGPFLLKALSASGPDISNPNGAAITLANSDRVGGITISEANVGILGNNITNTTLEQNTVFGGLIDGIQLNNFAGTANIFNNSISQNAQDGIHIVEGTGTYNVAGNTVDSNVRNGIFFDDTHGTATVDGNTLGSNGRGNWGGVQVAQTSGTMSIELEHNTIQYNTEGIYLNAVNQGTVLNANIHDNPEISYNQGDGIQIAARTNSTVNFAIQNNPNISFNGYPEGIGSGRTTGGGAAIRLYTLDSTMTGLINNNSMIDNAGNSNPTANTVDQACGIQGLFDGDSITSFVISNNIIDGFGQFVGNSPNAQPYGFGVLLDYENTNTVVQTLLITNNQVINSKGFGFALETGQEAVVQATFDNNIFANNYDEGLVVFADSINGTRLVITNNTIVNNVSPTAPDLGQFGVDAGLGIDSAGGNVFATIQNNIIDANGLTPNNSTNAPRASLANGISLRTDGFGTIGAQIFGNKIDGNADRGIQLVARDGYNNLGVGTQTVTLGVMLADNQIMYNGGDSALHANTPSIGTPEGPNLSYIAVDVTHNEASQPYIFRNEQQNPNTALVAYADGGLNAGAFEQQGNTTTLGTVFQAPVSFIDPLIAPLLTFP